MLSAREIVAAGDWSGEPADTVVLEFDERYRRRATMTGVGGLAFQLDLADATMLRGGDGLKLEDGRIVEVVAAPEPLHEIRAADPRTLVRIALRLGNRHAEAEATGKALRVRRDPEIVAIAEALGARVTPVEAPFSPEGADYVTAEAHAHGHGHHDDGCEHAHHQHEHRHHDHDHSRDDGHDHHHPHAHAPGHDDGDSYAEHQHHGDRRRP